MAGQASGMRMALAALLPVLLHCSSGGEPSTEEGPLVDADRSTVTVTPARAVANGNDRVTISVNLRDAKGQPVPGKVVEISATGSGNLIGNPAETSNEQGVAEGSLASRVAERKTISVSVGPRDARVTLSQHPSVEFVTAAETVAALVYRTQPLDSVTGEFLSPPVEIVLVDAQGRLVPEGVRDISVELGGAGTPSDLQGTTTVRTVDGVAVFSDLSLARPGSGYFLVARAERVPPVQSNTFAISEGSPQRLVFLTQPANALANVPIAPAIQVGLRNASGALMENGVQVTLALRAHASGAILDGTTTASTVDGVASFDDVRVPLVGSGYVLQASADGFQTTSSMAFQVQSSEGTQLRFVTQPSDVRAGVAMVPAVRVALTDEQGLVLSGASTPITLTLLGGTDGAQLVGAVTSVAVAGVASFDDVRVDKVSTGYTLQAAAVGVGTVASSAFSVSAGPTASFLVETATTTVTAGTAMGLTVTAQDAHGNVVRDHSSSLQLSSTDPQAVSNLPGTVVFTDGVASLPAAYTPRTAGPQTVTVTQPSTENRGDIELTVQPAAASGLRFTGQPMNGFVRSALDPVEVSVVDAFGNAVAAQARVQVTLEPHASGATLQGTTEHNTEGAVASFDSLTLDQEGDGFILRASASGLGSTQSAPFNVQDNVPPSSPANLRITGQTHNSLRYAFTAPGDDGLLGDAAMYEVRVSPSVITEMDFESATFVSMSTAPSPGTELLGDVTGLAANSTYHVAVRFLDGAGNAGFAVTSGTTAACPMGTTGTTCSVCAEGFHRNAGGACVDACTDPNPCSDPPANVCNGDVAQQHNTPGQCTTTASSPWFTCTYPPTQVDCGSQQQICVGGACINDPCLGFTCSPPPSTCDADNVTLTVHASTCVPDGPSQRHCEDDPSNLDCTLTGQVCHLGACRAAAAPTSGALLITEVMHSPLNGQAARRWFEVLNTSGTLLNLAGLRVEDGAAQSFTLPANPPILLEDRARLVLGASTDTQVNGGVNVQVALGTFVIPSAGSLRLVMDTELVDHLDYSAGFPGTTGVAMQLSSAATETRAHHHAWYWCDATTNLSGGGRGTPGSANGSCGINPTGTVDHCITQHPKTLGTVAAGSSAPVYSQFFENGATNRNPDGNDFYPNVEAELGFGTDATNPAGWSWAAADFNTAYVDASSTTDNDEMVATLTISTTGNWLYGFRYRLLNPSTGAAGAWRYCDNNGPTTPPAGTWGTVSVVRPTISSVSHPIVPRGSTFTVQGTGFTVVEAVTLGGAAQPFTRQSATLLTVGPVDAGTPLGAASLLLETNGLASEPTDVQVVALNVTPTVVAHGGTVTLGGMAFDGSSGATLDGAPQAFSVVGGNITVGPVDDGVTVGARGLSVVTPAGATAPLPVTVIHLVINEVDADQMSTDAAEFVEVAAGVPNVDLSAYTLVFFNGANDQSYRAIPLSGSTDANGLLLVGMAEVMPPPAITFPAATLQNGADAVALYQASAASFPSGTLAHGTGLIDALVYDTGEADDAGLITPLLGSGGVQVEEAEPTASTRCGTSRRDGSVFIQAAPSPGAPNTCP